MSDSIIVDLSWCQGAAVDFHALAAANIIGAISKCSHGANHASRDATFARNWRESKAAGVVRGAYLWLIPSDDPWAQIDNALDAIDKAGGMDDADLPLAIDFEQATTITGHKLIDIAERAVEHAIDMTGRRVVLFYSGKWYWQQYCLDIDSPIIAAQDYWHAEYPSMRRGLTQDEALAALGGPHLAKPWASRGIAETLWQFDGNDGLRLPSGVDADFNRFRGPLGDLQRYIRGTLGPREHEPPPTLPNGPAHTIGVADRAEAEADTDPAQPLVALLSRDPDEPVTDPAVPTAKRISGTMSAVRNDGDPPEGAA